MERRRAHQATRLWVWTSSVSMEPVGEESFRALAAAVIPEEAAKQIEMDVHCTFADGNEKLDHEMQVKIRRVLTAWAASQPEVGYCHSLSFIVVTLLRHFDEEVNAFTALNFLLLGKGLVGFFKGQLALVDGCVAAFDALLQEQLPALRKHLQDTDVDASLYLVPWLTTCFTQALPASVTMIVMEAVAKEGVPFMVKFAYVFLETLQSKLLQFGEGDDIVQYLQLIRKSSLNGRHTKILTRILVERASAMMLPEHIAALIDV